MPKLKASDLETSRAAVKATITCATIKAMMSTKDVAKLSNINENTYRLRMREPESLRIGELWKIERVLHMTDEQLLAIAKGRM